MKLNLYQILERLGIPFHILFSPSSGEESSFAIAQVRLYSPRLTVPRDDALYIARYQDLHNAENHNTFSLSVDTFPAVHLLVCGAPYAFSKKAHNSEIAKEDADYPALKDTSLLSLTFLETDEADLLWVLDRIQDILALYLSWDGRVQDGIWNNISVQETFDRCADIMRRPMGIFDLQQNLLMKTGFSEEGYSPDPLWRFTLTHGYTPTESRQSNDLHLLMHSAGKPFYYKSADSFQEAHRIIAPLYLNGAVFACLGMHDSIEMPTQGEIADFTLVQRFLNHALSHTDEFQYDGRRTPWFIVSLLQGMRADRQILEHSFQRFGIQMTQPFMLWNFRVRDDVPPHKLLPIVNHQFHAKLIFDYNGSILVMDTQIQEHSGNAFMHSLHNLLIQHDLLCARSMVFQHPDMLREAYLQSEIALLSGRPHCVNAYIDCYPQYIRKNLFGQTEQDGLLYPGIRRLLQSDAAYGHDLLQCLRVYMIMGRNASRTAKALFIHRHTVLYRLEKIEDLLETNLDQLEEKELALLYLSCLLLDE